MSAAQGSLPEVTWACATQVGGAVEYLPVLNSTRHVNAGQSTQFDVWLFDFTDLARMPVSTKMIPKSEVFFVTLDDSAAREQLLSDLVQSLKQWDGTGFPFLIPKAAFSTWCTEAAWPSIW